jgi:hypothetical protein
MNLIISQMVSLVCTYNDYVKTGKLPLNYLENSAFDHCETVGFILVKNFVTRAGLHGELFATNPVRWFKLLEKEGCLSLSLHFKAAKEVKDPDISPLMQGTWFIEAVYNRYSNFWHYQWFTKEKPSEGCRWDVRYILAYRFEDTIKERFDVTIATRHLKRTISKSMSFFMDNDFLHWSQACSLALKALESPEPQIFFPQKDIINDEGYPLPLRQVLYSALVVFMSPNDELWMLKCNKPEDRQILENKRDEFYSALINGLIAAVNQ